jgi:quinol monooxygenase YgiN
LFLKLSNEEVAMINVIASIRVKAGKRSDYLSILKANAPEVRKEKGCIEYIPTIDIDSKLPPQTLDKDCVTLLERWESLEALHAHLGAPHMLSYREGVKDLVESITIKVLREA